MKSARFASFGRFDHPQTLCDTQQPTVSKWLFEYSKSKVLPEPRTRDNVRRHNERETRVLACRCKMK
jgi:hypothetical protein